jgi:transcriptional regulator with XRE-family HTH domain
MEDIDVKIIKKRKELGLTQVQAAKHLQVSIGTYNQWESGMTVPSKKHIARVLDFLGIVKEKKLTAVEWLIKKINNRQKGVFDGLPYLSLDEIYDKAKQMEEQQLLEFWRASYLSDMKGGKNFEQYLEENYGKH